MKRKTFLESLAVLAASPAILKLSDLSSITSTFPLSEKMPVFFVGHGSPMNAISDNAITRGWAQSVKNIGRPKAILCVSAHWETKGTWVTAMEKPRTIHDFGGFPQALHNMQYNAPGSPEYACLVQETVKQTKVSEDYTWGLDHGTWSILVKMFPNADIPVFQFSLNRNMTPADHYALAKELAPLRRKGVLIVGSGNIVHNLRLADMSNAAPFDWAVEFDLLSKKLIETKAHQKLIAYQGLGKAAQLSIPTPEHYLPMLYIIALQEKGEEVTFFNEELAFRSGSMRSFKIG